MVLRRYALLAGLCLQPVSAVAAAPAAQTAVAPAAGQVTVVLKSGAVFHGRFLGRDERNIRIRSAAGTVRAIPLGQVARVEGDETPPASGELETAPPASPPASAGPAAPEPTRLGVGVSVSSLSGAVLNVPIEHGDLRVEPGISFAFSAAEGVTAAALDLGIGLFGRDHLGGEFFTYYGGRVAVSHAAVEANEAGADDWAFRLEPTIGVEWVPNEGVAIGVAGLVGLSFESAFVVHLGGLLSVRIFAP